MSSYVRRLNIAILTGAMLLTTGASSCLSPSFEAEPSGVVSGYECPPLATYTPEEQAQLEAAVEPGSIVDQAISDYFLVRELCR